MANHDPNHSSSEKTILWILLPAAAAVSLLFTSLNHKMEGPHEKLGANIGVVKKEATAPAPEGHSSDSTHVVVGESTNAPAAHPESTQGAPHAPAAHH